MNTKTKGFIFELLSSRANVIEVIFLAILLSLSVNLISSGIPKEFLLSSTVEISIGILLGLISMIYLVARLLYHRNKVATFVGFIVHNEKRNFVLSIPRYQFGEFLARYLKSAFSENKALKKQWNKEPLDNGLVVVNELLSRRKLKSHKIIVEATEYYILSKLSAHISDYFNENGIPKDTLQKFSRKDIPDVLLSNRFFELFSKPLSERAAFLDDDFFDDGDLENENIEFAIGKDGAMFNKFKLVLPAESKIRRLADNGIEIDTKRLVLKISIDFWGTDASLPFEYHKFVLDFHGSILETRTSEINVSFEIKFKPISFITASGWNFYYWADSFVEYFRKNFDIEAHLNLIDWESSLTVLNYLSDTNELYRQKHN